MGLTCGSHSHVSSPVVKASRREVGARAQQMVASLPAEGDFLSAQVFCRSQSTHNCLCLPPALYQKDIAMAEAKLALETGVFQSSRQGSI